MGGYATNCGTVQACSRHPFRGNRGADHMATLTHADELAGLIVAFSERIRNNRGMNDKGINKFLLDREAMHTRKKPQNCGFLMILYS